MVSRPTRPRPDAHRAARQLDPHVPIGGTKRSTFRRGGGYDGPNVTRQTMFSTKTILIGSVVILVIIWAVLVNMGWLALAQLERRPVVVPTQVPAVSSEPAVRYLVPGQGGSAVGQGVIFAALDGVSIALPAPAARVLWQASDDVRSMALAPQGQRVSTGQPMQAPQVGVVPPYLIHEDPQAVRPATGKAVVLVQPGTDLLAPISGTVEEVVQDQTTKTYTVSVLLGDRRDLRAVIGGLGTTPLLPRVALEAGQTLIGRADMRPWADPENPAGFAGMTIDIRPST